MYFSDKILAAHAAAAAVVVFDMNGTIVDDEGVQQRASNEILSRHGLHLTEDEFIDRCTGIKTKTWLGALLPHVGAAELETLLDEREEAYARLVAGEVRALARPGALELIRFASAHPGKKLALATSSPPRNVEVILGPGGLDVLGLFDFTVTGGEVKNAKPDPEIYRRVREAFPGAENFLVLEDTWAGVTAAKAAGMTCLAFPSHFTRRHDVSAADAVVDSLLPGARVVGPTPASARVQAAR